MYIRWSHESSPQMVECIAGRRAARERRERPAPTRGLRELAPRGPRVAGASTLRTETGMAGRSSKIPVEQELRWSERAVRYEPALLQAADASQALIVAVVVNQRHASLLSRYADQEIDGRHAAVIAGLRKRDLKLACACPSVGAHRHRLKRRQSFRDFSRP